ncbi:MAG: DUF5667 domain-containing protein [Actinomycetia bacterium]|nr:DUF5667 domain-containing protein [Actinomycetes bacterium]
MGNRDDAEDLTMKVLARWTTEGYDWRKMETGRDHHGRGDKEEHEDLVAIVREIRSIPRHSPRPVFRFKVFVFALFPGLTSSFATGRAEGEKPRRRTVPTPLRAAACSALVLAVAMLIFGGLSLAARNSKPGDDLYFVKRAWESVDLAFTWDRAAKARKYLDLADTRLSELDRLIQAGQLTPDRIDAAGHDYVSKTRAVTEMLAEDGTLAQAPAIAARLGVLKTTGKNIERRLAASEPQMVLARAGGARVRVSDSAKRPTGGPGKTSFEGRADRNGNISFEFNAADGSAARALDVTVEQDGRTQVAPLYPMSEFKASSGRITARVEPAAPILVIDQPRSFTMTVSGTSTPAVEVGLRDSTGTSTINGTTGEAVLETDQAGRCSFTLTKTSPAQSSRIMLRVYDGGAIDMGEVMTIGGIKAPQGGSAGVSAKITGPRENPQSIELSNGLLTVRVVRGEPGRVVSGVSRAGAPGSAGPLIDPLAEGEPAALGPRLTFANGEAAAYEVGFDAASGGQKVRMLYLVVLERGNTYASVRCTEEASEGGAPARGAPSGETLRLSTPEGSRLEVSGKRFANTGLESPVLFSFDFGDPIVTCRTADGATAVVACPIDSGRYPCSWVVGNGYVGVESFVSNQYRLSDSGLTVMVGLTDSAGASELLEKARDGIGIGDPAAARADQAELTSDGFLLKTEPACVGLKAGAQRIRLTVYKQYEKILGN